MNDRKRNMIRVGLFLGVAGFATGLYAGDLTIKGDLIAGSNLVVSGNVGIGTTAPTEKLEVNGNAEVSGTMTADAFINTNNLASGVGASAAGGERNTAAGLYPFVGGGSRNSATGNNVVVVGGANNRASSSGSFVGGGGVNQCAGDYGAIGGGQWNYSEGSYAAILGGYQNKNYSLYTAIGGGHNNVITGSTYSCSVIGGGNGNTIQGNCSVVPGGALNTVSGACSFAAGRQAKAIHDGAFVWADSIGTDFGSIVSNQFLIRATGGVGINTNVTTGHALVVAGSALLTYIPPQGDIGMGSFTNR